MGEMNGRKIKKGIIKLICPTCKKHEMELLPIIRILQNTFRIESPKAARLRRLEERKKMGWFCPECVPFFQEEFFKQKIGYYEKFITRC